MICAWFMLRLNHWRVLRGYCTSNQKLAGFVLYLKTVNALKKRGASYSKLPKELKNSIKI